MTFIDLLKAEEYLELFIRYGVDLILSLALIFVFTLVIARKLKKKQLYIWFFAYLAVTTIAVLFELEILLGVVNLIVITVAFIFILLHEGEWKKLFVSRKQNTIIKGNLDDDKIVSQAFYKMMKDLVITLSANKTGALITFERDDNLDAYIHEGVAIRAPLSVPLLLTIFYVGTNLHDGAVIVRDGIIEAASVFYLPTTKALNGKFGARHRAALGISEATDAVTIVVSEETGRISFTYQGEILPTSRDSFIADFADLMER